MGAAPSQPLQEDAPLTPQGLSVPVGLGFELSGSFPADLKENRAAEVSTPGNFWFPRGFGVIYF